MSVSTFHQNFKAGTATSFAEANRFSGSFSNKRSTIPMNHAGGRERSVWIYCCTRASGKQGLQPIHLSSTRNLLDLVSVREMQCRSMDDKGCEEKPPVELFRSGRRSQSASYLPSPQPDDSGHVVKVNYNFPTCRPEPARAILPSWETSDHLDFEEFARAISLGLYDYMRKSRSNGFVVSLSGGADSSAVACLVAIMVRLGCSELGMEQFIASIGLENSPVSSPQQLVGRLLTTVYQSTRNSSHATRDAAQTVADAAGADHLELDVDDVCSGYVQKVEAALGRKLDWTSDDIALQNIQARGRGPAAWLLANVKNALLLATSNRSEAAVGYATMDGDTCGGISPIAGIDKAFLRRWLRWLETTGPVGVGPIPALLVVNQLEPTAELRPHAASQTDENDLMPYDLLDAIEDQAIGERRSPQEVLDTIAVEFTRYERRQLAVWVRRFFQLWSRNQWKRERYAPSFHVDDKNLDPKTWCRFPILSGGFRRELSELDSIR